jgi:hypothetical protein
VNETLFNKSEAAPDTLEVNDLFEIECEPQGKPLLPDVLAGEVIERVGAVDHLAGQFLTKNRSANPEPACRIGFRHWSPAISPRPPHHKRNNHRDHHPNRQGQPSTNTVFH